MQATMAMKNLAIAGGLLCLFGYGDTRWSYDALRQRRRDELGRHDAERRAGEAERRAARAEGRVEGHVEEIGRAYVWTAVTNAQIVCRFLLDKKKHQMPII